jgi:hypothetical protein
VNFDPAEYGPVGQFSFFFLMELTSFFVIVFNMRAVAAGLKVATVLSDMVFSAQNFYVIKRVADCDTKAAFFGYTIGGAAGSLVSLYATRWLFGF